MNLQTTNQGDISIALPRGTFLSPLDTGLQSSLRALGHDVEDVGNLPVVIPETQARGNERARFLSDIADVCMAASERTRALIGEGAVPVILGGDHSIAVGTVAGVTQTGSADRGGVGLLWFDAHADMNTPATTPSGNVHGMALASLVGLGAPELVNLIGRVPIVEPSNVALIGVRDVDEAEKANIRDSGIHVCTMRDIDEQGMHGVIQSAVGRITERCSRFHVSIDMDFLDPSAAPGVGTPCPGGVAYRESHLAMEMIADSGRLSSFEVVEVNPILDEANTTARLAVELALSAFGKRIL